MTQPTALTFEEGYTRLQAIAKRVTSEEVPVAEMCDLFAEGKGLQQSLTKYLEEQKGRVESIERGEGVQAFRIVPPSDRTVDGAPGVAPPSGASRDFRPAEASGTPADDDIPF